MRAATISWMTLLSWILPLFLTVASEQEFVYWFLDYWLRRWIWCWLLRSQGPTSATAAERQHPHLGFLCPERKWCLSNVFAHVMQESPRPSLLLSALSSLMFSFTLRPLPDVNWSNAHVHSHHCQCFAKPSGAANKGDTVVTVSEVKCQKVTLPSHKVKYN